MEVTFDVWTGESIKELIQTLAEFRIQVFLETKNNQHSVSDEMNFLQHYLADEGTVIVANDCGNIVGYISCINYSEVHHALSEYSYFGEDMRVSEGPIVHPSFRNMGIGKGLIQEALNECELKDVTLFLIDATYVKSEQDVHARDELSKQFNFSLINDHNSVYKKELNLD